MLTKNEVFYITDHKNIYYSDNCINQIIHEYQSFVTIRQKSKKILTRSCFFINISVIVIRYLKNISLNIRQGKQLTKT